MVERQLRQRGIRDERVLAAMAEIPRDEFVPEERPRWRYRDDPIQIGYGQTISQPFMTALMAQELALRGRKRCSKWARVRAMPRRVLGALASGVVDGGDRARIGCAGARKSAAHRTRRQHRRWWRATGRGATRHAAPYDAISVAAGAPGHPCGIAGAIEGSRAAGDSGGRPARPGIAHRDETRRTH